MAVIVLSDVKFDSAGVSAMHETRAGVRHSGRGSLICFFDVISAAGGWGRKLCGQQQHGTGTFYIEHIRR